MISLCTHNTYISLFSEKSFSAFGFFAGFLRFFSSLEFYFLNEWTSPIDIRLLPRAPAMIRDTKFLNAERKNKKILKHKQNVHILKGDESQYMYFLPCKLYIIFNQRHTNTFDSYFIYFCAYYTYTHTH